MKKVLGKKAYISGIVGIIATLLMAVAVVYFWEFVRGLEGYGYLGVFIISLFAGSIMVMPIPYVAAVFTLGGVLNPALVGAASGLGASVGAMTIYLTGYGGNSLFQNVNDPLYCRLVDWVRRRGSVAVFIMSAVFNPLFIPMTIAMGMLRFRLWKFFLLCWAGNTVKSLAIAYAGYLGLRSLLRLFGVGL
ncbi:MAG: VTT domain-containing protein [Dehalococcoidales bacterium]|nr:VTT domain-containing protein [Dehalococcoidales bacterium]